MYIDRHRVVVTTDGSGDATEYTPSVTGRILAVIYTKHGSAPFANGVDFTITSEVTAENIWVEEDVNASKKVAPRQPTHDTAGVASLYAGSGEPVEDYIFLARDRVKIVVANGGDTKIGTFDVLVG